MQSISTSGLTSHVTLLLQEYVLIGEADSGVCGHPWLTWGCPPDSQSFGDDSSDDSCEDEDDSQAQSSAYVKILQTNGRSHQPGETAAGGASQALHVMGQPMLCLTKVMLSCAQV